MLLQELAGASVARTASYGRDIHDAMSALRGLSEADARLAQLSLDAPAGSVVGMGSLILARTLSKLSRTLAGWIGEGVNQDEGVPGEALFSLAQLRGRAAAAAAEQVLLDVCCMHVRAAAL